MELFERPKNFIRITGRISLFIALAVLIDYFFELDLLGNIKNTDLIILEFILIPTGIISFYQKRIIFNDRNIIFSKELFFTIMTKTYNTRSDFLSIRSRKDTARSAGADIENHNIHSFGTTLTILELIPSKSGPKGVQRVKKYYGKSGEKESKRDLKEILRITNLKH